MEAALDQTNNLDQGLAVLVMMLRFHGIAADPEQLRPGVLYFGAKLAIDGNLSVGELMAFNILSGIVSAPVL